MGSRKIHFFLGLSTRCCRCGRRRCAGRSRCCFPHQHPLLPRSASWTYFVQCFPGVAEILIHSQRSRAAPYLKGAVRGGQGPENSVLVRLSTAGTAAPRDFTRASYFSPKSLGPRIDCRGNEALPLSQTVQSLNFLLIPSENSGVGLLAFKSGCSVFEQLT